MTIEKSHGKARPSLPRSSDLSLVVTASNPTAGRDEAGRFVPGNGVSKGARWKASLKKLLGPGSNEPEALIVHADAKQVCVATMRSMPCDLPAVRSLVALHARHVAVAGFFTVKASAVGLETEKGLAFLQVASDHGQRAERLIVTALDVASKLAKANAKTADASPWLEPQDGAA